MKTLTTRLLPTFFLAGALAACTVGDTAATRPDLNAADAGEVVDESDAGATAQLQWSEVTAEIPGIAPEMHYVSPTEIYAVIGTKISMWDGSEWLDHTIEAIGLAPAMHFVSPTQIYAVVGEQISMWDGIAWIPMTEIQLGMVLGGSAEFHYVSDAEMYAILDGTRIAKWTGILGQGGAWADYTEILLAPDLRYEMQFVGPEEIYVVIGQKVAKWTGVLGLGGAFADVTLVDQPDLAPAIHALSDTEIYAVTGEKVSKWDGTEWTGITEDMSGLHPSFHYKSDEDITAIAGLSVSQWALADEL